MRKDDWIKMRSDLYRDPKVILMANALMDPRGPLGRYVNQNCQCNMAVTLNVMRNVVVGALVSVWGVTRHRGKRDGHNLSLPCHTLEIIDGIAEIDGFGEAMLLVGWVAETDAGLTLPNFFREFNVDPNELAIEKRRESDRKRKKKSRDMSRDMSRDCHVKSPPKRERRERVREEGNNTPLTPQKGGIVPTKNDDKPAKTKRSAVLPPIPETLDTPEFRAAWADWERHRRELRKPLTPTTVQRQFAALAAMGTARAVRALEHSIAGGYIGIFEPHATPGLNGTHGSNGSNGRAQKERFMNIAQERLKEAGIE